MKRNILVLVATVAALILPTSSPVNAATPVARWDFNEAQAEHPDSINGLIATSGDLVQNTGTTINMPYVSNWKTAYLPGRLTRVPHTSLLNPGTGDFIITVRYRTTRPWGNLIQKGQNGAVGGYFKIELAEGRVTCLFRDSAGVQRAARSVLAINDGAFHEIRCQRVGGIIEVWIDGQRHARNTNRTGSVGNTALMSIAGKNKCTNQPGQTSCDYFVGEIDYVQIDRG